MKPQGKWYTLGDYIGGARYMGRCPCGIQHMSTHDRVYVVGGQRLCVQCGHKATRGTLATQPATSCRFGSLTE